MCTATLAIWTFAYLTHLFLCKLDINLVFCSKESEVFPAQRIGQCPWQHAFSLFLFLSAFQSTQTQNTHADSTGLQSTSETLCSRQRSRRLKERPPRLYVEQRGLNEGCIEIAPLFFRVSPTKGLFPIQDTRSLDNTHRDLKATQWGRDH